MESFTAFPGRRFRWRMPGKKKYPPTSFFKSFSHLSPVWRSNLRCHFKGLSLLSALKIKSAGSSDVNRPRTLDCAAISFHLKRIQSNHFLFWGDGKNQWKEPRSGGCAEEILGPKIARLGPLKKKTTRPHPWPFRPCMDHIIDTEVGTELGLILTAVTCRLRTAAMRTLPLSPSN